MNQTTGGSADPFLDEGTSREARYRLIAGLDVARLGSRCFLYDRAAAHKPVVCVPTQRIRPRVFEIVRTILRAVPHSGWPLPQIVDLFDELPDRKSIPALVRCGYLEAVPNEEPSVGSGGAAEPDAGPARSGWTQPGAVTGFDEKNRRNFFRDSTFFNVPRDVDEREADVGLMGVPFASVPHSIGTELGPAYVRGLTQAVGVWPKIHDEGLYGHLVPDGGLPEVVGKGILIKDFGDLGPDVRTIDDLMRAAHRAIGDLAELQVPPLFVGGDHAVTFPLVHAMIEREPDLVLVHFDAHDDLFYTDSVTYSHAAVVSNLLAYSRLRDVYSFGLRPHFDGRVRNVTALTDHPEGLMERVRLHSISSLRRLLGDATAFRQALGPIGDRPVYLSVDLDVLSPGEIGGRLSTPAGAGLRWEELFEAVSHVFGTLNVVGADIVELNVPRGRSAEDNPLNAAYLTLLMIDGLAKVRRRREE